LAKIDPNDQEFEGILVTNVVAHPKYWDVYFTPAVRPQAKPCIAFVLPQRRRGTPAPRKGDRGRLYGQLDARGEVCGHIRGIVINRNVYRYMTREMLDAENRRTIQCMHDRDQKRYDKLKMDLRRRFAQLPSSLQQRIERLRPLIENFDIDRLELEIFVSEQAVVIAEAVGNPRKLLAFRRASDHDQHQLVPGLSTAHSGLSLATACDLTRGLLGGPTHTDKVVKYHSYLQPICGGA